MQVETFGKGKEYTHVKPVSSFHSPSEFRTKFEYLFNTYARHIIPAWYLMNTKVEIMKPLEQRRHILGIVTDFAENILVIRKHELAEQYFHRAEILLFGGIASFVSPGSNVPASKAIKLEGNEVQLYKSSHLVSSDYR